MAKTNLYKGILQPIIIRLLEENHRMYGFEMTQRVKGITAGELTITEGALYPLLHKLEAEGILESEMEFVSNRKRKYYSLTSKGQKEVIASRSEVADLMSHLQLIFHLKPV